MQNIEDTFIKNIYNQYTGISDFMNTQYCGCCISIGALGLATVPRIVWIKNEERNYCEQ